MARPCLVVMLFFSAWISNTQSAHAADTPAFNFVVISSSNIGRWPIGIQLRSHERLAMNATDMLRAINSAGHQIVLAGPGTRVVPASERATESLNLLQGLLRARSAVIDSFVVRQGALPTAPNAWLIDLTTDGAKCLRSGTQPELWQPASGAKARARLGLQSKNIWVDWPENSQTVEWPAGLGLIMGQEYSVEIPALNLVRKIRILPLQVDSEDPIVVASTLLSHGCVDQAMRYLQSLPLDDVAA